MAPDQQGPVQRTSVTVPGVTNKIANHRPQRKVILQTKKVLHKQADRIAKQATEHEHFLSKVTYCLGVVGFGIFCYLLGSRPQDIPYVYCAFFLVAAPLRWIYYKSKKWHYFLLDFCYYANLIFTLHLLFFSTNQKLFMVCFAFSEGPLAWALIVWRCSLVFSSVDKIVSVLIHLLPGVVQFVIRWWDPVTFAHHSADETGPWPAWPPVENVGTLWIYLFLVPLAAYTLWQCLYWLYVEVLRKQRMMNDPEVLTSYRELSRKAARSNNIWWRLSGVLGDKNRVVMYAILQAVFTVATMALAVPMFRSYRLHAAFQIFKIAASIWQGGNFFFDVMPRQVVSKNEKKKALKGALPDAKPLTETNPLMNEVVLKEKVLAENEQNEKRNGFTSQQDSPHLCAACKQASLNNLALTRDESQPQPTMTGSKSEGDLLVKKPVQEEEEAEWCGERLPQGNASSSGGSVWEEDDGEDEVWQEAAEAAGVLEEGEDEGVEVENSRQETGKAPPDPDEGQTGTLDPNAEKGDGQSRREKEFLRRRHCASQLAVGGGFDQVACAS